MEQQTGKIPVHVDEQKPRTAKMPSARLTISEFVYHQVIDGASEPTVVEGQSSLMLSSDATPYVRPNLRVGEEWKPLETGWVDDPLLVIVENLEGRNRTVNPSDEERVATAAKVVEVAVVSNIGIPMTATCLVPPGQTGRFFPAAQLVARCRSGEARIKVTAIPR